MRRVGILVLLAIAIVVAGCPADGSDPRTLTPAQVPDAPTVEPTPTPVTPVASGCRIPTPAPADESLETPGNAAIVPTENGTVNASALGVRHLDLLRAHRYRITTPESVAVVTRNRSAIVAAAIAPDRSIRHYVVDGRRHTYLRVERGARQFRVRDYAGSPTLPGLDGDVTLTGEARIRRVLDWLPHRVAAVRSDGWTVLRARIDEPTTVEGRTITEANSTVVVDAHGIVRSVETRNSAAGSAANGSTLDRRISLSITKVGNATIARPEWVCTLQEN